LNALQRAKSSLVNLFTLKSSTKYNHSNTNQQKTSSYQEDEVHKFEIEFFVIIGLCYLILDCLFL